MSRTHGIALAGVLLLLLLGGVLLAASSLNAILASRSGAAWLHSAKAEARAETVLTELLAADSLVPGSGFTIRPVGDSILILEATGLGPDSAAWPAVLLVRPDSLRPIERHPRHLPRP